MRILFLVLTLFIIDQTINAQVPLPPSEVQKAIQTYANLEKTEIDLATYLAISERIYNETLRSRRQAFCPPVTDPTGCTNGDFEEGFINENFWTGEYGSVYGSGPFVGELNSSTFQCGIQTGSGAISLSNTRHTIIPAGDDPTIAPFTTNGNLPVLKTVPDNTNNNYALRIGNSVSGRGAEMVTKSFVVEEENEIFSFDYAVVLENPSGHTPQEQPTFMVRVIDQTMGQERADLVDLGNGSNLLIADLNNDFFIPITQARIVYTLWQCAQINLSELRGHTVTVEFIVKDCAQGAHFGYAYIDNICSGCQSAPYSISFNQGASMSCGTTGKICLDYKLVPSGTAQIELKIEQNGNTINRLQSPILNSGQQYCFDLAPSDFGNITSGLVNLNITGNFTKPGNNGNTITLPKQYVKINDYRITCLDLEVCCPPMNTNLLRELFDFVQVGNITSPYQLKFNGNSTFVNLFQSYLDYISNITPGIDGLVSHWRLIDAEDGTNPVDQFSPALGDTFSWFKPNQGGVIYGNNNFFDASLNINHWYKIHTGIYTEPFDAFDNGCLPAHQFFYRVSIEGKRVKLEISDGSKVIDTAIISPSKKRMN